MGMLRSYLQAPWRFKLTVLRATGWVAGVRLALWVLPYKVVQRALECDVAPPDDLPIHELNLRRQRILSAVAATSKHLLGDKPCLTQALVARRLLRQQGYDTDLRIGVTKEGGELLAHAWLEKDRQVILGGRGSQTKYVPLAPVQPEAA